MPRRCSSSVCQPRCSSSSSLAASLANCPLAGDHLNADKCRSEPASCRRKYVREEVLEQQFTAMLGHLRFDDEVLDWVRKARRASHADERHEHEEAIKRLQAEHRRIGERISAMCDKPDGMIGGDFFDKMVGEWREEQRRLQRDIDRHEEAEQSYDGVRIVALARNAHALFERQPTRQKRCLLNLALWNCIREDREVVATFRQTFDQRETIAVSARSSAENNGNSSKNEIWLGRQDSNLRMAVPKTAALPLGDAPTVRAN